MTPFDQAWALLKMPLVRDSIEYGEPNYSGFPTATATFQHPDDPNVQYPMEARADYGGTKVRVTDPSSGYAGDGYFRTGHDPNPDDTTTSDINTRESHRRKGIGTAMYDLINEMGKTKGVRLKTQPKLLSSSSAPLWAKVKGLPYDSPEDRHKFHRRPGKLEWPEEGVYG